MFSWESDHPSWSTAGRKDNAAQANYPRAANRSAVSLRRSFGDLFFRWHSMSIKTTVLIYPNPRCGRIPNPLSAPPPLRGRRGELKQVGMQSAL